MSRLPSWLKQVDRGVLSEDGRSVIVTFAVSRLHPGYWLDLIRCRLLRRRP